ncbi:MAG: hypothetical protein ACK5W4_10555 [Inhella sp.]|jgi:hypothetical protein|uniref:hypothetical protein n=1 Tax=Inhella sp. TaxID=1921806 RepID=UPI00391FBB13|nr:hypothetical protein [Rubrivivax sp.]
MDDIDLIRTNSKATPSLAIRPRHFPAPWPARNAALKARHQPSAGRCETHHDRRERLSPGGIENDGEAAQLARPTIQPKARSDLVIRHEGSTPVGDGLLLLG